MKRSVNMALMGVAAFTASFAGGSAYLAWQKPSQAQSCTTKPDGTQSCTSTRTPAGVARYVYISSFPDRAAASTPSPARTDTAAPMRPSAAVAAAAPADQQRTVRRGFGASAKTAFRSSAGG